MIVNPKRLKTHESVEQRMANKIGKDASETDSLVSELEVINEQENSKNVDYEGGSLSSGEEDYNSVSSNTHTNSKENQESRIIIKKFSRKTEENIKEDNDSSENSNSSSSDNTETNPVNSSSITVSQDRESSTIE